MKRIIVKTFSLMMIPYIFTACTALADRLEFTQPEIVSVTPGHFATGITNDTEIMVSFTKEMDTVKTDEAFSLSSTTGTVNGYFRWSSDRKTLTFTPKEPLSESLMYTIAVSSNAEDTEGNDLREALESVFYVSNDIEAPSVISHQPLCPIAGGIPDPPVPADTEIIITFSEAMDPDTFHRGFSISPPVQGRHIWNAAHTVFTFDPLYDLSMGTTYTVSLTSEITDINNNALPEQYTFAVTVGNDFTSPEVVSVIQPDTGTSLIEESSVSGIERNGSFTLTFNEPVKRNTLHDSVKISPSCDFHIECPSEASVATLVFDNLLESEETYELTLGSVISDISGNTLERDMRYSFLVNGANSTRPCVQSISDPDGGIWEPGKVITLNLSTPPDYPGVTIEFTKEINPCTIELNITREVGSSGSSPSIINPEMPSSSSYRFGINGVMDESIYKIVIKGGENGLRDTRGNTMKEDYIQYIRF